jgi:hypothetical protein
MFIEELVGILAISRSLASLFPHEPDAQASLGIPLEGLVDFPHRALIEVVRPSPDDLVEAFHPTFDVQSRPAYRRNVVDFLSEPVY